MRNETEKLMIHEQILSKFMRSPFTEFMKLEKDLGDFIISPHYYGVYNLSEVDIRQNKLSSLDVYFKDFITYLVDVIKENKENDEPTDMSDVYGFFTQNYMYRHTVWDQPRWMFTWYQKYHTQSWDSSMYHELIDYFGEGKVEELKTEFESYFEEEGETKDWESQNLNMLITLMARDWLTETFYNYPKVSINGKRLSLIERIEKRYRTTLEEVIVEVKTWN